VGHGYQASPDGTKTIDPQQVEARVRSSGTYQESCPLGVLELSTFLKLTSI
jgi:hypothetical protein